MSFGRRSFIAAGFVLAAGSTGPAAAADSEERLLVVGDSQAQGLAAGLQRAHRHDRSCRIIDRTHIATGLTAQSRFDWPAAAAGIAEAEHAGIAVVMFGANDRPPPRANGRPDDGFASAYGSRVEAVASGLHRSCPSVIWVGHPIVRDPAYAQDMALLNRIYADHAVAAGAVWFPSWSLFQGEDGGYTAFGKGVDTFTTRLRADDGVHLTPAGYDVLAKALEPLLAGYWAAAPGASAGRTAAGRATEG